MPSFGIDRNTGKRLVGWPHVVQSLLVLFSTRIGSRIMRRAFGSDVPALLGRENVSRAAVLRFWTAIILAVELWEPRFRIVKIGMPASSNGTDKARAGKLGFSATGQYRPYALQGDFTSDVETKTL